MGGVLMDYYPVVDHRPVTMQCVLNAAIQRNVPANVLLAIEQIEGGSLGLAKPNKNGTLDFGPWQINSTHLKELSDYGVPKEVSKYYLMHDGCYGAEYAAYRLQKCFADPDLQGKGFWTRAACYHSKTPKYNLIYQGKLRPLSEKWGAWLSQHFTVKEIQP